MFLKEINLKTIIFKAKKQLKPVIIDQSGIFERHKGKNKGCHPASSFFS